jgi:hypothetical protein
MAHRAAASCDRLVTPPGAAAKCNIIHAALRSGAHPEGLQDDVDNSLGRQDVAADNRGVVAGVQDRALRDVYLHGGQATLSNTNKNISQLGGHISTFSMTDSRTAPSQSRNKQRKSIDVVFRSVTATTPNIRLNRTPHDENCQFSEHVIGVSPEVRCCEFALKPS